MPPCGWRPFLGENGGGCPLTLDVLGRWRPLISRVLGAAPGPFIVALSTRIRFAFCPAAPAGDCRCWSEPKEAGVLEETHDRDQIIQRVAALDVGKAELTCCVRVPGQGSSGRRTGGGPELPDDDPLAAGAGRPAGGAGRDPGGHGGHQRLLERGLLPAGSPRVPDVAGQRP